MPFNILLVDDDRVNVALAQQQLAILGYGTVDLAVDGRDALEKCAVRTYQLILTDQFMPGLDGNFLAATLRKNAYPAIIIMITACRPSEADCINLDAVLLKPVSLEQLQNVLAIHCHTPVAASASASAREVAGSGPLWEAFLEDYAMTLDTLEDAARDRRRETCLQQLHKLKGALGILQQPIVKRVTRLEKRTKTAAFKDLSIAYRSLRQSLDQLIASRQGLLPATAIRLPSR